MRSIEHGNLLDEPGAREIQKAGAYLVPTMVTYEAIWREGNGYGIGEHQLQKINMAREKSVEGLPGGLQDRLGLRSPRRHAGPPGDGARAQGPGHEAQRGEVRAGSVDDLSKERELVRLFLVARREADPSEARLIIDGAPQLTLAVVQAARSEVRSQSAGSRAVRRSPRLAWDVLIELYGDEATMKERIESLKATAPEGADELLELADKYLAGWRPKDFDDG